MHRFAVATLVSLFFAFSAHAANDLKMALSQEPDSLNPLYSGMAVSNYIAGFHNRPMVSYTDTGGVRPHLIEKVPSIQDGDAKLIKENGEDKLRIDLKFKKTALWGDGKPVTCRDLALTRRLAREKKVPVNSTDFYNRLERLEIDKKNPRHCTLIVQRPAWDFAYELHRNVVPAHIEGANYEAFLKSGGKGIYQSEYEKNPLNPGLYNGPYRIVENEVGSHLILEPNKKFENQPSIKRITVRYIKNTGTIEANLLSGNIDMVGSIGMDFDQAMKFNKRVQADNLPLQVNFKSAPTYERIRLNMTDPILSDIRVRQALIYGINRDAISQNMFSGLIQTAHHMLPVEDAAFNDSKKHAKFYRYSPRKAKKLLEKAGWKMQGKYRYKDGKRLTLEIMTTAGRKFRELVQAYVKDQLLMIGVDLKIANLPARVMFGEWVRKAKFKHMALYANGNLPEYVFGIHSRFIPTAENSYSGGNKSQWKNAEVDRIYEAWEKEFDANKRRKYLMKMLKAYTTELPAIPLYFRPKVTVTPSNLVGYKLGTYSRETFEAEHWSLREDSVAMVETDAIEENFHDD